MTELVVQGGTLLLPEGQVAADLVIQDGLISFWQRSSPDQVMSAARTVDATGLLVAPGFIDLQCNGVAGIDLTAEPERLWEMAAILPRWGVTAWLPTIVTSPEAIRQRAMTALAAADQDQGGAVPLGLHLEGPFLSPDRKGAHAPEHLRAPDLGLIEGWSRDTGVAMATLAPELSGSLDLVGTLVDRDVVVSLGHSAATTTEARAGVDAGARAVTHLFNAMGPLHHREPGLAGVALTDERLTVGVIADGLHVDPTMVDLAARALGDRLALVTDAVAAMGAPPGPAWLGDVESTADGESVRLADGTLAGSLLSLDRAVGNLMSFAGAGLEDAVRAATATPARLLGLSGERGVIAPGAIADLVLLDEGADGQLDVMATLIGGTVVYDRRAGES